MSDQQHECKCTHNNHSHFFLYWIVFMLFMNTIADCSGEETRLKNQVRDLDSRVHSLEYNRR